MARAFIFGDGISTDLLAPGNLLKRPAEELSRHCLTAIDPEFPDKIQPGDIVFAGRNFGQGSSREQAVVSLKLLGVRAVLAKSFARIFYRNALNLGFPLYEFEAVDDICDGQQVELDLDAGSLINSITGQTYSISPLPLQLMEIIEAGGLIAHLAKRFKK